MPEDLSNLFEPVKKSIVSSEEEIISAMPTRFKRGGRKIVQDADFERVKKSKKGLKIFLIILGVIFLIVFGGFAFYFWASNYLQSTEPTPAPLPAESSLPTVYQSPEIKLTAEIRHQETGKLLSSAEFFLPEGALVKETVFDFGGINLSTEMATSTYAILAGIYKISFSHNSTSSWPVLLKPLILKINYDESLVKSDWENFIKIGYFKDGLWTPTESSIDVANNTVSVSLASIPVDTFALIVEQARLEGVKTEEPRVLAPSISSSQDLDADGLTDVEEQIYQTNPNNPDTDADGSPDGLEVINLNNPKGEGAISLSGLINVYTNPTWQYKFFYPAGWLVKALPETENRQIMVVTNTGEFFEILVEDNNGQLSPKDWYLEKSPGVNPLLIKEDIVGGLNGAWSADGLNLYLSKGDKIYILSYDVGTETLANFKSTFQMLIKSFGFINSSF